MNSPSRAFIFERKKENRKVSQLRVDLEGGCGNQLFQFFAAYSISRSKDVILVVNTFKVNQNRHKGFSISQSSYLRNLNGVRFVSEQIRDSNRIREKLSVHLGTKYKPNEKEKLILDVVNNLCEHPDTDILMAPLSSRYYLINKKLEYWVRVYDNGITITNHKFTFRKFKKEFLDS